MSDGLLAAYLLTFSGIVSTVTLNTSRANYSIPTFHLAGILTSFFAALAIPASVYFFIAEKGLWTGLGYWVGWSFVLALIVTRRLWGFMDALRSVFGLLALLVGSFFAVKALVW